MEEWLDEITEVDKVFEYNYFKPELSEEYLEHHGILGQRKGVRNGPPYPLGSDVSTGKRLKKGAAASKKKPKGSSFAERRKAKKTYKKRVQAAQKAREARAAKTAEAKAQREAEEKKAREAQEAQDRAEKEAMDKEIWRQDVIRKGDISSAREHADMFSTEEVNAIINKYQADQKLSQLVADSMPKPTNKVEKTKLEKMTEKVDTIKKYAGTVADLADSAKKVYDAYTKVSDILNSGQKKQEERNKAQAEADTKANEDWKKNIIMTRDLSTALANKNKFTSDEINNLLKNVEADEKLEKKLRGDSDDSNTSKKEESKTSNQNQQSYKQETSKSQSSEKRESKPDLSPSLFDKVMARAQNAASEQRSANQRQSHDKAYYQQQSTDVLKLMKSNLEEDNGSVSQINIIDDILKDRRKRGR